VSEKHERSFEHFDLKVLVNDDGESEIVFVFPERYSSLSMVWDDLREVVDFVAKHALGMETPMVVEWNETQEALDVAS
jgi:hypothetical protein